MSLMCISVDGQWDFDNYHIVSLGEGDVSVRCLTVVANQRIWCAHRNRVHIVDPESLKIEVCHSLVYHSYVVSSMLSVLRQ